jgi:hypothetical protein
MSSIVQYLRNGLTGSTGRRIDGAMPFLTSSLMLRMVCCRVKMLSVKCCVISSDVEGDSTAFGVSQDIL